MSKSTYYIGGVIFVLIILVAGMLYFRSPIHEEVSEADHGTTLRVVEGSDEVLFSIDGEGDGGYADPSVIEIEPGRFLMYLNGFGAPFDVNDQGIFVLESADMINWIKQSPIIFQDTAVGRAVKMDDIVRFYYPTTQPFRPDDPPAVIQSAFSPDGIFFIDEPGARLEPSAGNSLDGVTVIDSDDGLWHMYFTETDIEETLRHGATYSPAVYRAVSQDGIVWHREDDSALEAEAGVEGLMPIPQLLRPFVIERPEGGYWMFYNSHTRGYYAYSEDGISWEKRGMLLDDASDIDAVYDEDGNLRLFFGRRDDETFRSSVHTVVLE